MAALPAKIEVLAALRKALEDDLGALTASQKDAVAGATHEENKSEGDKDMRSTEVSYLARGLAKRVTDLREAVALLSSLKLREFPEGSKTALTALVLLEDEEERQSAVFLAPCGGGEVVVVDGIKVAVVTPSSPLGQAILGKARGDAFERETPHGSKEFVVEDLV